MTVSRDALMSMMVSYHQPSFYNDSTGTFSSRGRAALTAECLRKMLTNADSKLRDSRFVEVQGKLNGSYVFIPRILHQWHPSPFGSGIEAELETVVRELQKDLA